MRYLWPEDTVFEKVELEPENRDCPFCGRRTHLCDHRHHKIFTCRNPLHIVSKLSHCPEKDCPGHHKTFSSEDEMSITMPWWLIGWDVFAWIGHRRFARHWSVPQIHDDLMDTYQIILSRESIRRYIYRYQTMLAARQQDPQVMATEYRDVKDLILSIDGLQPEKGHETLYVVRELRRERVWFAESLISSSAAEVRRILVQARQWAEQLGLPVQMWVSDKQDAFVSGIAAEFPETSHRYCDNHFLRDVAEPVLEIDSQAKVKMRSKVRGLRAIERDVLKQRRGQDASPDGLTAERIEMEKETPLSRTQIACVDNPETETIGRNLLEQRRKQDASPDNPTAERIEPEKKTPPSHAQIAYVENPETETVGRDLLRRQDVSIDNIVERQAGQDCGQKNTSADKPTKTADIVLAYCTAVRGILNDNRGGPLKPPGLRMAESLREVRVSLQRNLDIKKGAPQNGIYTSLPSVSTAALRR